MATITNVVSSVNLRARIDLLQLARKAKNVEYRPGKFPAVIVRSRNPNTTALVFTTGKMIVSGAKSIE